MPLLLYKSEINAEVAVWKTTEKLSFYKEQLRIHHFPDNKANEIKQPEKIRQWYASRYLLCEIFPGAIQLYKKRKPILFNGPEISFSHSGDVVAVMLSSFKSGIDIQVNTPKLEVIKHKFLNPSDLLPFEKVDENTLDSMDLSVPNTLVLCKIWAIKEAVFKFYITELPFKDIHIDSFNPSTRNVQVTVNRKGKTTKHELALIELDGTILAYVRE